MNPLEIVRDNFQTLVILVGGYVAAAEFGYVEYPEFSMPTGTGLVITAGLVVAVGAYYYADRILDLLPDEEGIYLVAFKSSDETGGEIWELTEDQFDDMTVVKGTLFEWPVGKRVYECREYRRETNEAVGNWRESVAASELAGNVEVVDAFEAVQELRDVYEPEAQKFRRLQRRLRGVVRELDRRRLEDQQAVLDPHLTPTFGDEGAGVGDVLRDELPEDLLPESMTAEDADRVSDDQSNGRGESSTAGIELLDDPETPEPEGET